MAVRVVEPCRRLRGTIRCPGDKSISHRYALLGALADGATTIDNYAPGDDCAATLACLARLGVSTARRTPRPDPDSSERVEVQGRGLGGLQPPTTELDAANSGTCLRLLTGILAAHPFTSTITGDISLRRRPMRRIADPLSGMGARITSDDGRPPLTVMGGQLRGIDWEPEAPSAQVKSAILLAGLHAAGGSRVREPIPTRDHTERALTAFGVTVTHEADWVGVRGGERLHARSLRVPGDLSSAAFWVAAAAALPGSRVEVTSLGLNPTRTYLFDLLSRLGARVDDRIEGEDAGEPVGRVSVEHRPLAPIAIAPAEVPRLIDEIPALAALGALGAGFTVTGAGELRTKESDRISALVTGLRGLGVDAQELTDGIRIPAGARPTGGAADAAGDHRLAMAFAIVALGASGPSRIMGAEIVDVSYPRFFETLERLRE